MNELRLHTKTTLLVAAILLAMLIATLIIISFRIVNLVREDEKELARLLALGAAEQISLLSPPHEAGQIGQILNQARLARPREVALIVWRLDKDQGIERIVKFAESTDGGTTVIPGGRLRLALPPQIDKFQPLEGIGSLRDFTRESGGTTYYHVLAPIFEGQNVFGLVEIIEEFNTFPSIISDYARTVLVLAIVAIALTMAAIYFLFRYLVYHPISQLDEAMTRVQSGSLNVSITVTSNDEFGRLALGFNRMISRIGELTRDREAQQETLRDRIREATKELQAEIIERKRAETESNLAAERYRVIFESTPLPMWVYDPETLSFLTVNEAAETTYGWNREEFLELSLLDLYTPAERAGLNASLGATSLHDHGLRHFRHLRKDGRMIDVESYSHELIYEGRRALLVISSDTTEKKQAEAAQLRSQRLESIGTLASGIAHDLNNILSPLTLSTYLLRSKVSDPSSLETLETMEEVIERAGQLVRQVLSYARGIEGERTILNPGEIVREVVDILRETLPRSIELQTSFINSPSPITANPTQIHQVLMNLCLNARDAMPGGGSLNIELSDKQIDATRAQVLSGIIPGSFVVITVSDTGTGIESSIIDQIFDPFFTTKERGHGSGLGLSTSIGIVRSHSGTITVESVHGQGSTFRVYLPAVHSDEEVKELVESMEPPGGEGETILLIDDEEPIRRVGRGILEAFGYNVITANNGQEAEEIVLERGHEIQAILTDLTMPNRDGLEVIRTIRSQNDHLQIIASSGLGDTSRRDEALRAGANFFLPKPYSGSELLWIVHEALIITRTKPLLRLKSNAHETNTDS